MLAVENGKKHHHKADKRDARTYGNAHGAEDVGVKLFFRSGVATHKNKSQNDQTHGATHKDKIDFFQRAERALFLSVVVFCHIDVKMKFIV